LIIKQNEPAISIAVHPYIHAYFTNGVISRQMKWFFKYRKWITLIEDSSLGITDFKFLNKEAEVIEI
jgi:ribonuclease G